MRTFEIEIQSEGPMLWGRQINDDSREETTDKGSFEQAHWRERMATDDAGRPVIPRLAINNSLTQAMKPLQKTIPGRGKCQYGKLFARCLLPPRADVVLEISDVDVKPVTLFVPSTGQKGGGKRVNRVFAHLDNWKARFQVVVTDNAITLDILKLAVMNAGMSVGLGAMRPGSDNCGQMGRFSLVSIQELACDEQNFNLSVGDENDYPEKEAA